ncbi:MAG: DUF3488 and transglutaminase-like domain-containing protein, partial [Planctomycetota bacterium]
FDLALLAPLGLAVVAYQLAEPGEIIPPIALIAAVVARALQDARGWVLGKSSIALAVAAAIVYVIVDVGGNEFQVTLFADFMMILAALKAMEDRTPRDDGQLLVVSLFVALSAAVSSNRMGTGILLVLYLFTLMFAIMRVQVDAAMWPKAPERRGRLAPLLGGCIVGSTIVASLSFVLLPRSSARWSPTQFSPVTQRVAGFTERVELGRGGLISQDPREVMRVWQVDYNGETIGPFDPGTAIYLRGVVLSEYGEGRRAGQWSRRDDSSASTSESPVLPGTPVQLSSSDRPRTLRIVQHAGASSGGTVFTVWHPTFVSFDYAQGTLIQRSEDLTLRFDELAGESIEYRVTHGPQVVRQSGPRRLPLPETSGSDTLRGAAVSVLENAGIESNAMQRPVSDDARAVEALESWLRGSKGYTLDIEPAPPGRDPTEWFVAEAEAGHCEYFASSLALLCREVGINTRVATGYLAVVDETDSDFARVRRSDAHAWVEAEIAPGVWRVFDATPAASGEVDGASVDALTRWLSSIESVWLASFVSFDARSQSSLSRSVQRSLSFDRFDTSSEDLGQAARRPWLRVAAAFVFFGGIAGIIMLFRNRRRVAADVGGYSIDPDLISRRDTLEAGWNNAGTPRPRGVSLLKHAATIGADDQAEAQTIERLAFAGRP